MDIPSIGTIEPLGTSEIEVLFPALLKLDVLRSSSIDLITGLDQNGSFWLYTVYKDAGSKSGWSICAAAKLSEGGYIRNGAHFGMRYREVPVDMVRHIRKAVRLRATLR